MGDSDIGATCAANRRVRRTDDHCDVGSDAAGLGQLALERAARIVGLARNPTSAKLGEQRCDMLARRALVRGDEDVRGGRLRVRDSLLLQRKDQTLDSAVIARLLDTVDQQIAPFADLRGSEWYKRRMARLFVKKAVEQLSAAW